MFYKPIYTKKDIGLGNGLLHIFIAIVIPLFSL